MNERIMGLKEIAKATGNTSAAVSNWRQRNSDFPRPINEVSGIPIFMQDAITNWLDKHEIEYQLDNSRWVKRPIDKIIATIGRARVGKTRLVSKFSIHEYLLRNHFSGEGSTKTNATFKFVIERYCSEKNCKIRYISPESSLNGIESPLEDEAIKNFLDNIINHNTFSQNTGEKGVKKLDIEKDIIEIITSASALAMSIMDDDDDGIIIYDTPGVGKKYKGIYNVNASYYVFMMRSDEEEDFDESLQHLIPHIGSAKVLYVYCMREAVETEQEYEEMRISAQKAVDDFAESLKEVVGGRSIIDSTIELLNPSETIIPMGIFKKNAINYAEEKFNSEFGKALKSIISKDAVYAEEEKLKNEFSKKTEMANEIIKFAKELVNKVVAQIMIPSNEGYTRSEFFNENHDRVKFNDDYQILRDMEHDKSSLSSRIYCYFQKEDIDLERYPLLSSMTQQLLIKYCYRRLNEAVKQDCGIAVGTHNFEANPPLTMWTLESIIADELYDKGVTLSVSSPGMINDYVNIMKRYYTSSSWGYVYMRYQYSGRLEYCNYKIDVIHKCGLNTRPADNRRELISNCYNIGLMMLGVFAFYSFIIDSLGIAEQAIDWI